MRRLASPARRARPARGRRRGARAGAAPERPRVRPRHQRQAAARLLRERARERRAGASATRAPSAGSSPPPWPPTSTGCPRWRCARPCSASPRTRSSASARSSTRRSARSCSRTSTPPTRSGGSSWPRARSCIDVPDTGGRYYVIQLLDAYSNTFAYIGRRTTGTRPGSYALVPPGYTGPLPAGVRRIESPTNLVWLLGRTLVRERGRPARRDAGDGRLPRDRARLVGRRASARIRSCCRRFPPSPPVPIPTGRAFYDAARGQLWPRARRRESDACALRAFAARESARGARPDPRRMACSAPRRARATGSCAAPRRSRTASAARATTAGSSRAATSASYGRNWLGRAVVGARRARREHAAGDRLPASRSPTRAAAR